MSSEHLLKFSELPPDEKTEGGLRIKANKSNFPILQGMSLYKLVLEPKGIREPHWHANADELGFCLKGEVLINLYATGNAKASFLVQAGEVFLIPSGALHDVENVGNASAELILCFSHEDPEDFHLSSTFGMFSDAVLGNTWQVKQEVFKSLKRSPSKYAFATLGKNHSRIPEEARYPTPYRYALEASQPLITNEGGRVHIARQDNWPIAKRQALYSLQLTDQGMREPHWHPETAELGYVAKGKGRMSILNPSGKVDTYLMEEGDVYFIPKAYPHHIENITEEALHILIFFDQGLPQDIGFTGSVRSYSSDVLASVMKTTPDFFQQLPKYYQDLLVVQRINPVD